MAVKKLSQITLAVAPPALTDQIVGVQGGATDVLYTLDQVAATTGVYQNIKTNWGAVGDGVTDDSAAFSAFQTFAQALTRAVILVIPPGTYLCPGALGFYTGIKDFTVIGYGATFVGDLGRGGIFFQSPLGTQSARVSTTAIGDNNVTLLVPAQTSIFAVGNWVAITSLEMQGVGGYPPNFYFCEYCQITTINAGTGVITLDRHLRYAHQASYPSLNAVEGSFSYDVGGPASIFLLHQDWAQVVRMYGLTISVPAAHQSQIVAQYFYLRDVTWTGAGGIAPSQSLITVMENCVFGQELDMEVDKNITLISFLNCHATLGTSAVFQSSSIDKAVIDGGDFGIGFTGAKHMEFRNFHCRSINVGSGGYGHGGNIVMENCQVAQWNWNINQGRLDYGGALGTTFSNGTIQQANTNNTDPMFLFGIPGVLAHLLGNAGIGDAFLITNIRADATNTYIDTTLTTLPTWFTADAFPRFVANPCMRLSAKNNWGNQFTVDLSKAPSDQPFASYLHRWYTGNVNFAARTGGDTPLLVGTLVKVRVNVIRAYTGAQSTLNALFYGPSTLAAGVWSAWNPSVNMKIAGERVVTPGSVAGAQTGDSIPTLGAVWFGQDYPGPYYDQDISADTIAQQPILELEFIFNLETLSFSNTQFGNVYLNS